MTEPQDRKPGPGIVVWIALGFLAVLIVIGFVGSRRTPPPESISQEVKTLAVAPSVEVQLPEKEQPPPQSSEQAVRGTLETKPEVSPAVSEAPSAVLEEAKNLPGKLRLGLPVETLDGEKVLPLLYTCYRANISPPLQWAGAPAKAKSFALLLERREKDTPAQIRWAVFNIPGSAKSLSANLPKQAEIFKDGTAQARNDQGYAQYVGPCDAQGKIEYVFRLFALDHVLKVAPGAPKHELVKAMNGHIIDEADLPVVHYFRIK
ncbi:MAG TPA: YbhB/YbcL family Raf kinase inhibitor-like protein [Patescibacteria group bacterium]|nr:YbhB/YbcL family Raf kinase inhibitor-like protein [Patescibacteria group bacterium]